MVGRPCAGVSAAYDYADEEGSHWRPRFRPPCVVYAEGVKVLLDVLLAWVLAMSAAAQTPGSQPPETVKYDAKHPPRFDDFPVAEDWDQPPAPLKLTIRSERMFRTQLANAAKEPPNFAGHYRITFWGCGSLCGAGAVVDLQTGSVFPPPLGAHGDGWARWIISPALFEGSAVDFRINSRLVAVKSGINYSDARKANVPDAHYFVWEDNRFRQLLYVSGKQPSAANPTRPDHRFGSER